MTIKPFTKYCSLPPHTIVCGYDNSTFYAFTAEHEVTVKVENSENEFKYVNCGKKCPFYISNRELSDVIAKESTPVPPARIPAYCLDNEICNASPVLMAECAAGHSMTDVIEVTLSLPKMIWVWDFASKGAKAWKVYGIASVDENNDVKAAPFLLPNVYPEGHICWRKGSRGKLNKLPQDLQQAYYTFFSAPFNDETSLATVNSITEYLQNYDFKQSLQDPEVQKSIIDLKVSNFEKVIMDNAQGYKAIMATNDPKNIEKFPYRVTSAGNTIDFLFAAIKPTLNSAFHKVHVNGYECLKVGKLKGNSKIKLLEEL